MSEEIRKKDKDTFEIWRRTRVLKLNQLREELKEMISKLEATK